MSFVLSPNMALPIPGVGTESGPQFAYDINSSLTLVDMHDHSAGKGVQVTPAGLNINSTLTFNGFSATNLSLVSFVAESTVSTTLQSISVSGASSINELWYTDSNGTQTQITKNGAVNVVASSIPGESYAAGTFIWTQTQSSLPTTPANFDIGSVIIRPNTAGTTRGVVLGPPGSISSQYNIQLPLQPASTLFMTLDSSGNMGTASNIAGTQIATNTITATQLANTARQPFRAIFTSSGTFTLPAGATTSTIFKVTCVGGGGGGGTATGSASAGAGGGGAGSTAISWISGLSANQTVTIGIAGFASSGSNLSGGNGGTTTFGSSLVVAGGGTGAPGLVSGDASGGSGGVASTADIPITGQAGTNGASASGTAAVGGVGGSSTHGGGGLGGVASGNGIVGGGFGSGGGGSGGLSTTSGAGTHGICLIEWVI